MNLKEKLENKRRLVRLISFVSAIVFASAAVMFATFMDNALLLTIILLPCVITLSISMIPLPLSARSILITGIISCVMSLSVILYVVLIHPHGLWKIL